MWGFSGTACGHDGACVPGSGELRSYSFSCRLSSLFLEPAVRSVLRDHSARTTRSSGSRAAVSNFPGVAPGIHLGCAKSAAALGELAGHGTPRNASTIAQTQEWGGEIPGLSWAP